MSRQPRLNRYALLLPHSPALPEAGETTSRAGRGNPTARAPGSGRRLVTRTSAATGPAGSTTTARVVWLTRNGLAALPYGEPRTRASTAPKPDSDSDGTYHPSAALTRARPSGAARRGSDSYASATRDDPLGSATRHPSVPSPTSPGPARATKFLTAYASTRPRAGSRTSSPGLPRRRSSAVKVLTTVIRYSLNNRQQR